MKLYYYVYNCGDGSVFLRFFNSLEDRNKYAEVDQFEPFDSDPENDFLEMELDSTTGKLVGKLIDRAPYD